jgi:hypothetical protein
MQTMMGNAKPHITSKKRKVKFDKSDCSDDEEQIFTMSNIPGDMTINQLTSSKKNN